MCLIHLQLLTLNKQTASYFSSKNGLTQNQQRIATWGLQPWWATCKSHPTRRGEPFYGRKGSWEGYTKQSPLEELRVHSIVAVHWLSYDSLLLAELLTGKKRKSFFFLLGSAMVVGHESSPFWPPDWILFGGFCLLIFTHLSSDCSKNKHILSSEMVQWTVVKRRRGCRVRPLPW